MDGFTASLIVVGYRALVPFAILRWPLGGIFLSMIADASDAMLFEATGWGLFEGSISYSLWDKVLDLWYLFFAWIAAHKFWTEPRARKTADILFWWRALGVGAFFFFPHRILFVLAPNIFENFYILWTVIRRWWPSARRAIEDRPLTFGLILLAAAIPKIIQEAMMHWFFENQTWGFFRTYIFWWLYQ